MAQLTDVETVEAFRARARVWLAENMERRAGGRLGRFDLAHLQRQRDLQARVFAGGFAGISVDKRFGGQGLTPDHEAAFVQEAREFQMPDFEVMGIATFGACLPTLLVHASTTFLEEHVPRILSGAELWCQFFSEPGAGSDLGAARTKAVRSETGWNLSGAKIWSSFAHLADWAMCLARTDFDKPKYSGLTWFATPTGAAGLTIRPIVQFTGDDDYCEAFLDEVEVPDAQVIGEVDKGWDVTRTLLVFERGAGQASIPTSDGDPGQLDPGMVAAASRGEWLPDVSTRAELLTLFVQDYVYRQMRAMNARKAAAGQLSGAQASCAKLFRADVNRRRGLAMLRVLGVRAAAWQAGDSGTEAGIHLFLEAKKTAVAGGTEQMQRNAVGEALLGLPKDPRPSSKVPFNQL